MTVAVTRRSRDLGDVALALAVAALAQVDVWGPRLASAHVVGPRPVVASFYLVSSLSLAFRRHRPLAVALVVAGSIAVQSALLGASSGNGVLLPALVAAYTVAAHCELPAALAGGAVILAAALLHELRNPNLPTARAALRAGLWDLSFVAAWLLGAYLRTRRLYVAELQARTARAELEREERARAAVSEERARIARELHDAVAHGVSVMVVQAEAAEELLEADPASVRRALGSVQSSGREALVELRRLVGVLRTDEPEAELAPQPSLDRLAALVEQVRDAGLDVSLDLDGVQTDLPSGLELTAYRIVQEALTNVLKHARARAAAVRLRVDGDALVLEVSDDGRGPQGQNGGGHGLAGMRERVGVYGGKLVTGEAPGGGFRVQARLPLEQ